MFRQTCAIYFSYGCKKYINTLKKRVAQKKKIGRYYLPSDLLTVPALLFFYLSFPTLYSPALPCSEE